MKLPYSDELNIEYLGRLFDNISECYKFFWFKAIVSNIKKNQLEISYEELVDEMIADAWYMVTEYHLNLGPKDTLEAIVNLIKEKYLSMKSSEDKSKLIKLLRETDDKDIKSLETVLNQLFFRFISQRRIVDLVTGYMR